MTENQNKFENQLKSKVTSNSPYWIIMINYWHIWVLWIQGCSENFKASGNLMPCCWGKTLLRWPEISEKIVNWIWLWWRKEVEKRQSISQLWFRCMFSGILTQGGFIFEFIIWALFVRIERFWRNFIGKNLRLILWHCLTNFLLMNMEWFLRSSSAQDLKISINAWLLSIFERTLILKMLQLNHLWRNTALI